MMYTAKHKAVFNSHSDQGEQLALLYSTGTLSFKVGGTKGVSKHRAFSAKTGKVFGEPGCAEVCQ